MRFFAACIVWGILLYIAFAILEVEFRPLKWFVASFIIIIADDLFRAISEG